LTAPGLARTVENGVGSADGTGDRGGTGDEIVAQPTPDASDAVAFGAAHPRSGSTGPAGEGPPPPPAPQGSDLDALRHPYESTRFALALSGAVLVFGVTIILLLRGGGPGALIGVAAFLLLLLATVWWFLQIGRSRLLGRAAEVTPATWTRRSVRSGRSSVTTAW
jgi:hypothetical protein